MVSPGSGKEELFLAFCRLGIVAVLPSTGRGCRHLLSTFSSLRFRDHEEGLPNLLVDRGGLGSGGDRITGRVVSDLF